MELSGLSIPKLSKFSKYSSSVFSSNTSLESKFAKISEILSAMNFFIVSSVSFGSSIPSLDKTSAKG